MTWGGGAGALRHRRGGLPQLRLPADSRGAATFDSLISFEKLSGFTYDLPASRCFMRTASLVVVVLGGLVLDGAAALAADSGPVIVLPGRHGLPVLMNGVDVTGAVVEGDWGLYSPHMV